MSLTEYKNKRDLKRTPEPPGGGKKNKGNRLTFVVQRHKATSLHYDFRLEMEGVLKSWAVPKGPSLNPGDKRLAMMVEDHPLDYAGFEGIIPENHYGAGIVEIWDRGTYEDISEKDRKKGERKLWKDLHAGSLKFILHGKKLKGEFALVRMKGKVKENAWLLIKHQDDFAVGGTYSSEEDTKPNSPINRALRQKKTAGTRQPAPKKQQGTTPASPKSGSGNRRSDYIKPMLAKTAPKAFSDPEWVFEIKWDGYRAIAETGEKGARLYSRNGLSFAERYTPVSDELSALGIDAVLDGEIVAVNENGRPDFQLLQDYAANRQALYYYVFDLLSCQGEDLKNQPLVERKARLKEILKKGEVVRYCAHIDEQGEKFFAAAIEKDLEGIIAKRANSRYFPGRRSNDWLKIKNHHTTEAVIGGFTGPRGGRKYFGALILGVFKGKALHYVGHTGTGFTEKSLKALHEKMEPLVRKTSPFTQKIPVNNPATWIRPVLACQIKYTEKTREGILRHPVFQGLRIDKPAEEINWKEQVEENTAAYPPARNRKKTKAKPKPDMDTETPNEKTRTISKQRIKLTNLNKIFWPEEGITKGEVIRYYEAMSKYILPYLKGRPESLKRNPDGIADKGFFQKDAGDDAPAWVDTVKIFSESTKQDVNYVICNNKAALLYLANLGCIELNPWNSKTGSLEKPDYFIIDIDPSEKNNYDEVIDVALAVKEVMEKAGENSYCKTSGATGMHVYVPLKAKYSYAQARSFAELIARLVHERLPATTTLERSLQKRQKDKIYIDYLQNSSGQTLACAYSLRPRPAAPVSTPLEWAEVKHGLRPEQFTIHQVPERVKKAGDPFLGVLKKGIDMQKCLRLLDQ